MKDEIRNRIARFRAFMQDKGVHAFIVPSTDPHSGEYVPEHWEARKWISGFTGSAGTVVITEELGGLWTDSRYFLQAEEQLQGTGIALFKERMPGTPSIPQWLGTVLPKGAKVGIDSMVNTADHAEALLHALQEQGMELVATGDPFTSLWTDRPPLPQEPPFILPLAYAGTDCSRKLKMIRECLTQHRADGILISALDEIAWALNLRGKDVHCNPVFISYLLLTEQDATLYILPEKVTAEISAYLTGHGVCVKPYGEVENDLRSYKGKCILLPESTNYALARAAASAARVIRETSPVCMLKAVKNEVEINGFRQAMRRDGVAMVRFLIWLEKAIPAGHETEISIDRKLYEFRSRQEGFRGISFDTIAGYQAHGAIVHYEATDTTASALKPEGFLLLDSGGQYLDGTTDITRTLALGPLSEAQRKDYTLVLKGFIALSMAEFPAGTCGTQLDILARQFLWKAGMNYGHGTGHGVGHFLNVHEGPHQIRMNYMPALLQPGMTVTNEPGIYREGQYGVRTENTMLIVKSRETEFGEFYRFEPLTLCPIGKEAICTDMLTLEEKEWLNAYHDRVYRELGSLLGKEEQEWLKQATAPIV